MFNRYFKPSALGLNDKEINRIHERANRGFAESMFKLAIINLDATFGIKDNIEAKNVVVAPGRTGAKWVQELADKYDCTWYRIGNTTKAGHPRHPLFVSKSEKSMEHFDVHTYLRVLETR